MIDELREKLWQTMFLNPVSPSDLLKNAKDPSYEKVTFNPSPCGIEVELLFTDDGKMCKAIYNFDENDFLQRASIIEEDKEHVIFDRQSEIEKITNQLSILKRNKLNTISA